MDLEPKGELELFYGRSAESWCRHSWRDTKRTKLEGRVHDLFLWTILDADRQRSEQARREEQRRREAEFQALREKLEAAQKAKQRRIDQLVSDANARRQSEVVRSYIDAVMNTSVAGGRFESQEAMDAWADWACQQAARLDRRI